MLKKDIVREVDGRFELTEKLPDSQLYNKDLAPVPLEKRTWRYYEFFAIWVGMSVCVPTWMLAASMIAAGFNWIISIGTIALGQLIILIPLVLNSFPGAKYGIPMPVLLRSSFGIFGANIPALLRGVVAAGWFGIQTMIMAFALDGIFVALSPQGYGSIAGIVGFFNLPAHLVISFFISWIITVVICYYSPPGKSAPGIKWLNDISAPILLLIGIGLLWWAFGEAGGDWGPILGQPTTASWAIWPAFLTAMVAYWAPIAINISDLTRFAKTQKVQYIGQTLGLPTTMTAYSFIGLAVTSATVLIYGEAIWDPVALMIKTENAFFIFVGLVFIILATLTTNITANMVAPINDFMHPIPKYLNWERTTILVGIIGIIMQPWRFLADPNAYIWTWLLGYGAFLGPVAGVLIADFWIIQKQHIKLDDLYSRKGYYDFRGKTDYVAIVALLIMAALIIFYATKGLILGSGWPAWLSTGVMVLGILGAIYLDIADKKGINMCGALSLYLGIVLAVGAQLIVPGLGMYTWFIGIFIAFIAYYLIHTYWYGKKFPPLIK
ncbi:MAG: allantoin permease [Candidatus Methanofastidiosum methylothiophilum]|uniref:Allantoin permease n=1 Tax=Candidatus Methanofastidiosum methylothiophilum TaxID=1705564 RepID=A0A150IJ54_9EURY|nr:MAG: allantoin permease [Candidatus Methanofastidiosum methylthiophilus]KYC47041.1 MAG: allantoin permease [Candidatus Methanofastidiosum methylthiophilus]KYC49454.1 MAG: allantoin permease [Candidatus Methanofastidiosum methylthiophilus]